MNRATNNIIAQRDAGLISSREATGLLRRLAKQAQFNADYADHPDSYKRWQGEARAAARAARDPSRGTVADSQDAREFYAAARHPSRGTVADAQDAREFYAAARCTS